MADKTPQYIKPKRAELYLDWWRENPIEIILVVFAVFLFFTFPRTGCGISDVDSASAERVVVDAGLGESGEKP